MKTIRIIFPILALVVIASCNQAGGDKKAELTKLKKQRDELSAKISKLEEELAKNDTSSKDKIPLVSVVTLAPGTFRNYVEIQGKIDADENISLSPEMGGNVTKINVKVGDEVSKGQLLAEIDNKVIQQGIAEVQNSLNLAKVVYEKQKNLWDQKIGTEMQYLTAKNQKESLEKKLDELEQQLQLSYIKAPINGTIDAMDLRLGQMAAPGMPGIRIVNLENLKVKGEVSEAFAGKIKKGDDVFILFPDMNDSLMSKIDFAAKVISPLNRTFNVQINLDHKKDYHPNMIAIMKIVDYVNDKALIVPENVIQHAQEGDFVIVSVNHKAQKIKVKTGHIYNGMAEITDGLKAGDVIITNGFQDLNEGETVKY